MNVFMMFDLICKNNSNKLCDAARIRSACIGLLPPKVLPVRRSL